MRYWIFAAHAIALGWGGVGDRIEQRAVGLGDLLAGRDAGEHVAEVRDESGGAHRVAFDADLEDVLDQPEDPGDDLGHLDRCRVPRADELHVDQVDGDGNAFLRVEADAEPLPGDLQGLLAQRVLPRVELTHLEVQRVLESDAVAGALPGGVQVIGEAGRINDWVDV